MSRRIVNWIGLGVGVFAIALVAGIVFGRTAPDIAARQVVREFVVLEPVTSEIVSTDEVAPTSGGNQGAPRCGEVLHDATPDDVVASLGAGVVVLWAADATTALAMIEAAELAPSPTWLVVIDERLDTPVVATAWGVRMTLDAVDEHLIPAFVTGYAEQRGPPPTCS